MTQTGGLAMLFAWLIFAFFLCVLLALVARRTPDVTTQQHLRADGSPDPRAAQEEESLGAEGTHDDHRNA